MKFYHGISAVSIRLTTFMPLLTVLKYDTMVVRLKLMFKEYRNKKRLTQEQLAELAGLDPRTIQRIENKERTPSLETLAKLVIVLEISDEDLVNYIKDFNKNNK